MRFDLGITISLDPAIASRLDKIINIARTFSRRQESMMAMLTELVQEVADQTTLISSLSVFIQGLEDKINSIPNITPEQQAAIDSMFVDLGKNNAAIAAAMVTTPVEPVPVPPVV